MSKISAFAAALSLLAGGCFQRLENPPQKVPTIGKIAFAEIPAGRYRLGSVEGRDAEQPRDVETPGFYIAVTEITEAQMKGGRSDRPAAEISLDDAREFCRALSAQSGRTIRLPTPDEWEIAARGGIKAAHYPWGWGFPKGQAVFDERGPRRVRSFDANGYGLFDMAGNVAEWCVTSGFVAVCGGSWADRDPKSLRVFSRHLIDPTYRNRDVGFRVVMEN